MAQLPNSANVKDVIRELQTMEAINQKADLVSVVGAPATSSDSVAQVITKLVAAKTSLAANLTAKGQSAAAAESVQSLADKVGAYNGRRWAKGRTAANSNKLSVRGLSFRPRYVIASLYFGSSDSNYYVSAWFDLSEMGHNTLAVGKIGLGNQVIGSTAHAIYDDGFDLWVSSTPNDYIWIAFE
ncbi:hypothetical protein [Brevibacillus centrosporus]|uniref:hypothetical protein n=1 Tax=Brevibacillus centrosporus TaxID=54910 RepID=UPI003985E10B